RALAIDFDTPPGSRQLDVLAPKMEGGRVDADVARELDAACLRVETDVVGARRHVPARTELLDVLVGVPQVFVVARVAARIGVHGGRLTCRSACVPQQHRDDDREPSGPAHPSGGRAAYRAASRPWSPSAASYGFGPVSLFLALFVRRAPRFAFPVFFG